MPQKIVSRIGLKECAERLPVNPWHTSCTPSVPLLNPKAAVPPPAPHTATVTTKGAAAPAVSIIAPTPNPTPMMPLIIFSAPCSSLALHAAS